MATATTIKVRAKKRDARLLWGTEEVDKLIGEGAFATWVCTLGRFGDKRCRAPAACAYEDTVSSGDAWCEKHAPEPRPKKATTDSKHEGPLLFRDADEEALLEAVPAFDIWVCIHTKTGSARYSDWCKKKAVCAYSNCARTRAAWCEEHAPEPRTEPAVVTIHGLRVGRFYNFAKCRYQHPFDFGVKAPAAEAPAGESHRHLDIDGHFENHENTAAAYSRMVHAAEDVAMAQFRRTQTVWPTCAFGGEVRVYPESRPTGCGRDVIQVFGHCALCGDFT